MLKKIIKRVDILIACIIVSAVIAFIFMTSIKDARESSLDRTGNTATSPVNKNFALAAKHVNSVSSKK